MSETTSKMIEQILHNITNASSFIITKPEIMETMENLPSTTTTTTETTEKIITSTMTFTKTANISFFLFTSTEPSQEYHNNLLHIFFSLLYLFLCIATTVLIAGLIYWRRKRQHLVGEESSTVSDITNTNTNQYNSASLSSMQYAETTSSNMIFEDDSL